MLRYEPLCKLAITAAIAGALFCPLKASAQAAAPQDVQIFPPQMKDPTTGVVEICPKLPADATYSYTLVWDGLTNVQCATVPNDCPAGWGLKYDMANAKFNCQEPCSGPSQGFIAASPPCPAGQEGGTPVTVACDGSVTYGTPQACQPVTIITTLTQQVVTVGSPVTGQLVNGVLDQNICQTNPSACSTYTVGTGGTYTPQ
jgi:hypothetical protein